MESGFFRSLITFKMVDKLERIIFSKTSSDRWKISSIIRQPFAFKKSNGKPVISDLKNYSIPNDRTLFWKKQCTLTNGQCFDKIVHCTLRFQISLRSKINFKRFYFGERNDKINDRRDAKCRLLLKNSNDSKSSR